MTHGLADYYIPLHIKIYLQWQQRKLKNTQYIPFLPLCYKTTVKVNYRVASLMIMELIYCIAPRINKQKV